jgi:BirA family biotin operon repressor/biotin-[acetyl-CoA-carboxylase] ligase
MTVIREDLDSSILQEEAFPGGKIVVLSRTLSTQDVAKDMALRGEPSWTAVMALEQTSGRGRSGHSWISPPGKNLALSVILRPSLPSEQSPVLSMLAGVAVANVLESKGVSAAALKWPNDVLVDNKKIAGILLEATMIKDRVREVILGLGVNLNSDQSDFPGPFPLPPTSYLLCTGKPWDVLEAAQAFLSEIRALYEDMEARGPEIVRERWLAKWAHKGHLMTYDGKVGRAHGVSREGFLILSMQDGSQVTVVSGDVLPVASAETSPLPGDDRHQEEVWGS